MVKRRISITIDCDDETCGDCEFWEPSESECKRFKAELVTIRVSGQNLFTKLRCQECVDREEGRLD